MSEINESQEAATEAQELDQEQQALNQWVQALLQLAFVGQPFFNEEGEFGVGVMIEETNERLEIFVSRKPNNIIPFPEKKVLPKRI
jgi:hypothetical protein